MGSVRQQPSCSNSSPQQKRSPDTIRHTRQLNAVTFLIESLQLLQPGSAQLRLVDELLLHFLEPFVRVGSLGPAPRLLPFAILFLDLCSIVASYLMHDEGVEGRAQRLEQGQLEEVRVGPQRGHYFETRGKISDGEGEARNAVGSSRGWETLDEGVRAKGDCAA
jgi:hypothetical protein